MKEKDYQLTVGEAKERLLARRTISIGPFWRKFLGGRNPESSG